MAHNRFPLCMKSLTFPLEEGEGPAKRERIDFILSLCPIEFFHCVALGGMVKRILAKCKDGSPLIEKGTRLTVSGKLAVRKNKQGDVTYENVSIVVTDFSVSGKAKPKAEEGSTPAPAEAASSDIPF